MTTAHIIGMHGLGDTIHSRAVVRQVMREHGTVYVESPWFSPWRDLVEDGGLRVIRKTSPLRTQAKNAEREADLFWKGDLPPPDAKRIGISYTPASIKMNGSIVASMCARAGVDAAGADFRIPSRVPVRTQRQIMFFRPLTEREEWAGCRPRNPDVHVYRQLYDRLRCRYYTWCVADLDPGKEWLAGWHPRADVYQIKGQLTFDAMRALMANAALCFTPPGFATVLAQAVGTPCITVFGGYETAASFSHGARFSPWLPIEADEPCGCWRMDHDCDKTTDVERAAERIEEFLAA